MEYLFALYNKETLIGLFDNKTLAENMLNGLAKNKLSKKNNMRIDVFVKNSIFKTEYNNDIINDIEDNQNDIVETEPKLSKEEEKKINKERSELEYELNVLKKEKDKQENSKKIFKVDLDLYKKFKKIIEENNDFEIPELFKNKYPVFKMLDENNKLDWEHFYANYKPENLTTSYNQIFDSDNSR